MKCATAGAASSRVAWTRDQSVCKREKWRLTCNASRKLSTPMRPFQVKTLYEQGDERTCYERCAGGVIGPGQPTKRVRGGQQEGWKVRSDRSRNPASGHQANLLPARCFPRSASAPRQPWACGPPRSLLPPLGGQPGCGVQARRAWRDGGRCAWMRRDAPTPP